VRSDFVLFGWIHWLILLSIPLTAWAASRVTRRWPAQARYHRWTLGGLLLVNELIYYGFKASKHWFQFPAGLPLQLCDLIVWLTVIAAFTLWQAPFEFAFFTGLVGTSMAVITPDLWGPFPSYPTIYFFLAHGGIVALLLYLWWIGQARPKPGCVWRVMLMLNGYALAIGVFNWLFKTNYMYLCQKPPGGSLLDYFGPWPVYILAGELFALAFFSLLAWPFRRTATA
jgi:hypothetical integral membrane protein (TIGR02206 family)